MSLKVRDVQMLKLNTLYMPNSFFEKEMKQMVTTDQLKILKIINLSESKTKLDNVDSQFNSVRHNLEDVIRALVDAEEIKNDDLEEYGQIEVEIFHITKFIEKLGFDVRSRKRAVESDLYKQMGF